MSEKTKNEIKIVVVAVCIGLDVWLEQWWMAAFLFSYAVLRIMWLSAWELHND